MLSKTVIEEIGRLLAEGQLSQRRIAAKLRVSRGVVGQIATGRRGLHGRVANPDTRADIDYQVAPTGRCLTCGVWVHLPCIACRAQEYRARREPLPFDSPSDPIAPVPLKFTSSSRTMSRPPLSQSQFTKVA